MARTTTEWIGGANAGKKSTRDRFYLTSLAPPDEAAGWARLLSLVRSHWLIENRLHHVKDRTMREDAQSLRRGRVEMGLLRGVAAGRLATLPGETAPLKMLAAMARPREAARLLLHAPQPRLQEESGL